MNAFESADPDSEYPVMLSPQATVTVLLLGVLLALGSGFLAWRYGRWLEEPQKVRLTLSEGGFYPAEVVLDPRRPVELTVHRVGGGACTSAVVVEGTGLKETLPPDGERVVRWSAADPPPKRIRCGMGCLRARVRLEEGVPFAP